MKNTFFINPTTPEDVKSEIKTLNNNKPSGTSSILTKIFKTFDKPLSKPVADLINLSFSTGKFPSLQIAKVIPIFKKGDKLDCNNYRPISLIFNISKIIEKLMHRRLFLYLAQNSFLYNLQLGFRNGHSATLALLVILDLENQTKYFSLMAYLLISKKLSIQ